MKIYHYADSGLLVGESVADESPQEPGTFIIPAWATSKTPPEIPAGKLAVLVEDDWTLVDIPEPPVEPAVEPTEPKKPELASRELRAQAYRNESDPIFFKEQRGEVPAGTWLAMVNEIKARYPNAV